MSLNRYRLRHLADKNHGGAMRAVALLKRPDKLITLILLGNNFINVLITQLATYIGYRLYGEAGIAIAAGLLTLILLLFAEVTPKTLAAANPEKIALPAAYIYQPLAKIFMPVVVVINWSAKLVLKLLLISDKNSAQDALNSEELRIAVHETSGLIPDPHRDMLLSILDLEKVTVDDIMVPRSEIIGIDLEDDWHETLKLITNLSYTRIPIYSGNIDNMVGIAQMRKILPLLLNDEFNPDSLVDLTRDGYFIPEGTPLTTQLINFRTNKRRIGFVVDEYGDIQGLVTIEDILEEIVGEFTTDTSDFYRDVQKAADGSYIVQGSANVRELNRTMKWNLPTEGPKTINGLILEELGTIPDAGVSLSIAGYLMEILQASGNAIRSIRIQVRPGPTTKMD